MSGRTTRSGEPRAGGAAVRVSGLAEDGHPVVRPLWLVVAHRPRAGARPRPGADRATARDPCLGTARHVPTDAETVVLRPAPASLRWFGPRRLIVRRPA